ncbi:MAG: DciA family protein [Rhodanobacteraceae bacterium]
MTLRPLKTAVGAWTPAAGAVEDPLRAVREAWPAIAGADVARHSRPSELDRGVLTIVTQSSAWSQQLSFLTERIVSAVAERAQVRIERIRFRVGRVNERARQGAAKPRREPVRRGDDGRAPCATLDDAVARFRDDVTAAQRAKAEAGWKECIQCGVRVEPAAGTLCLPCVNVKSESRARAVAQLLYDAPWLEFAGVCEHVEELDRKEYDAIRMRLLQRWWDILTRLVKSGRRVMTNRERMVASSYVLLKSGLDPERIAPTVVRDLLGDELHDMLYGNERI